MMTWTLILILWAGRGEGTVGIHTIEGFATEKECRLAGLQIAGAGRGDNGPNPVRFTCLSYR